MKRLLSICLLVVMVMSLAATAFAEVQIPEFKFSMSGAGASQGIYKESSQTAKKDSANYKYASFRVTSWDGYKPTKNIYVGLNFQGYIPACTFEWLNVSKTLSIRVTPKLNDPSKTGTQYKYCAAMRLNTVETAATVHANGKFTPDGR